MIIMEFKVYYEFTPDDSNPFPLADEEIEHNLRTLPEELEHYLPDTQVLITKEDYENRQLFIKIKSEQSQMQIKAKMERVLSMFKLFSEQLNVEPVT